MKKKKKRLPKASEVIFPEIVEKKKKVPGQPIVRLLCPDCNSNDEFRILEVVKKQPYVGASGLYRCQCTACDFIQTIKSKNPSNYNATDKRLDRPAARRSRPRPTSDES